MFNDMKAGIHRADIVPEEHLDIPGSAADKRPADNDLAVDTKQEDSRQVGNVLVVAGANQVVPDDRREDTGLVDTDQVDTDQADSVLEGHGVQWDSDHADFRDRVWLVFSVASSRLS